MPGMFDRPNCRMCVHFEYETEFLALRELNKGKRNRSKRQYSNMKCKVHNKQVPMCGTRQPDWCVGKFEEK